MKKMHYLKKWIELLLPYTCIFCKQLSTRKQDLCENCLQDLPFLTQCCTRCAKPLSGSQSFTCGQCLSEPPSFDRIYALFEYQPPVTKMIMSIKFNHRLAYAKLLGELLTERIQQEWYLDRPLPEAIIPVPLHPKRIHERGFNQALEIARPVGKALGIPVEFRHCLRVKHTVAQAMLPAKLRGKNVRRAFRVKGRFPYSHVAVLDDVVTTGQTVGEFCEELRRGGVLKIDVWCCGRR